MARKSWLLMVAMAGLALGALVPPFLFRDQGTELPPTVLLQLKAEASHAFTIPPGVMHVTDIHMYGEHPYRVEGTVIYRSLFGLPVASVRAYNSLKYYENVGARWFALIGGFILVEGLLGFLLFRWEF